jgi:ADP-ribosylglycohydrolase
MPTRQYDKHPNYGHLTSVFTEYARLKNEYGSKGVDEIILSVEKSLKNGIDQLEKLPVDKLMLKKEPNMYDDILRLRPKGPRRIWKEFPEKTYRDKLEGALLGRFAGCTLGTIVEFWEMDRMERFAKECVMSYPANDYWTMAQDGEALRYQYQPRKEYTRNGMDGVPVDDDLVYTLLGLLIAEEHGVDFTVTDVGKAWIKYLPHACTAENIALKNLKKGIKAEFVADKDNPYCEWIGADIRSDPFGYMAPGYPEKAAAMAYQDAYISHRRNGIYGEMFFSAAIAAAFTVKDPLEAIRIGLTEIPADCSLTHAVKWALKTAPKIKNYKDARKAVDAQFEGMSGVHTNNNACLTIFGLAIGGLDFTKVTGETVAMGLDNDCTAATAGSIVGAITGKKGIPKHWTKRFNNKVHSYLIGKPLFKIDDLVNRFTNQAENVHTR